MNATVTAGLMWPPLNEAATKTAMKIAKPKANAMFSKVVEPRKQLPGGAWTVGGQKGVSVAPKHLRSCAFLTALP